MEEQTLESRWRRQIHSAELKPSDTSKAALKPALPRIPLVYSYHPLETIALYRVKVLIPSDYKLRFTK